MHCRENPAVRFPAALHRYPIARRVRGRLGLFSLVLLAGCEQTPPTVAELSGRTMGTSYSIKLSPSPGDAMLASLKNAVEHRLATINGQMSTYRPDSDLMRFNQTLSTDWQQQPLEVVELVERANRISALTEGRYDISVGPLVNLWGFGNSGERNTPPSQQEINDVLNRVGYGHLQTRRTPPALRKDIVELQIDLSSIAKGWAVDEIAELVRANGVTNFLIEIGGELRAQGEKAAGTPWRIAVERPSYETRSVERIIELRNTAMATSGDYRNFFVDGDRRYSHTIDPTTGQPVQQHLASVTVLTEDCATADAWATALLALGDRHGPDLADAMNLKVLFIIRSAAGQYEKPSHALAESGLLTSD